MFHPLWEDLAGSFLGEKSKRCGDCGHGKAIHRANGACGGASCLCGWTRGENGALFVKSTGESASEVKAPRRNNRGAPVYGARRQELLKIPCYFCGEKAESIDHLIPRARGGKSTSDNLVSACHLCNGMKSDKLYEELIAYCKEVLETQCASCSLRKVKLHALHQAKAVKILDWHSLRLKSKGAPVP